MRYRTCTSMAMFVQVDRDPSDAAFRRDLRHPITLSTATFTTTFTTSAGLGGIPDARPGA